MGILSILTLPVRKKRLSDVAPGDFEQALSSSAVRPLLFSRKYAILISVQYRGRAPGIAKERISIHKQYWTVRSRPRLFIGLAFTIAGFMLFYTILTVLVLEPEIPWRLFPWGAAASASRFWLLAVPLLSIGCCILLRYLGRRGGREELLAFPAVVFCAAGQAEFSQGHRRISCPSADPSAGRYGRIRLLEPAEKAELSAGNLPRER